MITYNVTKVARQFEYDQFKVFKEMKLYDFMREHYWYSLGGILGNNPSVRSNKNLTPQGAYNIRDKKMKDEEVVKVLNELEKKLEPKLQALKEVIEDILQTA